MGFINTPIKTIGAQLVSVIGVDAMPWYDPSGYPLGPSSPNPIPVQRDYTWHAVFDVDIQYHSSKETRSPGEYDGMDVSVGQWVANAATGQTWQIIKIYEKSRNSVAVLLQDVYRYNTFRDSSGVGNGTPPVGVYVIFHLSDDGTPQIDPVPESGTSSSFSQNLGSRFEYINTQYDFPLYQKDNTFVEGDIVAADSADHKFVLSDATHRIVVGRVTSVSDTKPGWFTVNPVQKVVDYLDYLPGNVGDIIHSDGIQLTLDTGGPQVYLKLRNNTQSTITSSAGEATVGSIFQLNGQNITVSGTGDAQSIADVINLYDAITGVSAQTVLSETSIESGAVSNVYGEPALYAAASPATILLNGTLVTFNLTSSDDGYTEYARIPQMIECIMREDIPGIIASSPTNNVLRIVNTLGGSIDITGQTTDLNGVNFAGANSATGLPLSTPASTNSVLKLTAIDSRPINLLDVYGTALDELGLVSVENGVKAAGLYIRDGLRSASSTVVANLSQLLALQPMAGDSAFVIDSTDVDGNNVGEWSMWVYDGTIWVQTSNQDSATTDAKSIEYMVSAGEAPQITVGKLSTGRRITLITVEVTEAFDAPALMNIGYRIDNPQAPEDISDGLMKSSVIDLTVVGVYTCSSSVLFGTDTVSGDVTVTAEYASNGATIGTAQIIVSYV